MAAQTRPVRVYQTDDRMWWVGPYHRELELPEAVNGPLTNATYGNGVLVLSMPKVTRGEHVGHRGRDIQPASA